MNHYAAIKVNGKKVDLHRHIVQSYLGRKLTYNVVVHHKDKNKLNNDPDNLDIMTRAEHTRLHLTGKKLSTEVKTRMSLAQQKQRNGANLTIEQVRAVKTLLGQGMKQIEVARIFNVSKHCIWKIKSGRNSKWI